MNCIICGKEFIPQRKDSKCCSDECKKELSKIKKRVPQYEERQCKKCRAIFIPKRKDQYFCCIECRHKYEEENRGPRSYEVTCDYCGKKYLASRNKTEKENLRFCSKKCADKYRKEHSQKIICPTCHKEFLPYRKNQKFCSRICRDIDNYKKYISEEFREAFIKYYVKEKNRKNIINKRTKPHQEIDKILEELSIPYQDEVRIGRYIVDIEILSTNKIIEIMGRFWHGDTRYYGEDKKQLSFIQQNNIDKDQKRNNILINDLNKEILYLWEDDIYFQPELCRQLIFKFINDEFSQKMIHSSDYCLENNEIKINPIAEKQFIT